MEKLKLCSQIWQSSSNRKAHMGVPASNFIKLNASMTIVKFYRIFTVILLKFAKSYTVCEVLPDKNDSDKEMLIILKKQLYFSHFSPYEAVYKLRRYNLVTKPKTFYKRESLPFFFLSFIFGDLWTDDYVSFLPENPVTCLRQTWITLKVFSVLKKKKPFKVLFYTIEAINL